MPKLEKGESWNNRETKKQQPLLERVVCLGSVGAMEINENPCENSNELWKKMIFFMILDLKLTILMGIKVINEQ